jgi:hypothetical protein
MKLIIQKKCMYSVDEPPLTKEKRAADYLRSGIVSSPLLDEVTVMARREVVRIFGGKTGQYHTVEGCRRFPYGRSVVNLRKIPRFYFSASTVDKDLPLDVVRRTDYEARFQRGGGPLATDEDNRVIQDMTPALQTMADTMWKAMSTDKRYQKYTRRNLRFNNVSVQVYRNGDEIQPHEDRRRRRRQRARNRRNQRQQSVNQENSCLALNSMREGSVVGVFTVGTSRVLSFRRRYFDENANKVVDEQFPCYSFLQEEGTFFVLDPADEELKQRRDFRGGRRKEANFVHEIEKVNDKDAFSVAFVFRCVDSTTLVDTRTDRVVWTPTTEAEKKRREQRNRQRAVDNQPSSDFELQVQSVLSEYHTLMKKLGWINDN